MQGSGTLYEEDGCGERQTEIGERKKRIEKGWLREKNTADGC
jgi:hypothetical protein